MLWAALSFATGIVTGVYVWRPPLWWLAAWIVLALSATYLLRRRGRAAFSLGLGVLFVLGAFIVQVCGPDTSGDSGLLKFADGSEVVVTAHVTKEGSPQAESSGDVRQRLDLETEQITRRNERFEVRSGLRLSIYDEPPRHRDGRETGVAAVRLFHTVSACAFRPSFPPRATSAIPAHLIIAGI